MEDKDDKTQNLQDQIEKEIKVLENILKERKL